MSERNSIVGSSQELLDALHIVDRVAPTDLNVLITGETGTGKELVATRIHQRSHRRDAPFVVFDCSAVPEALIASQLFGHVRGAFTGAVTNRKGSFQEANGGTLFLDELGELPISLQPMLLRVLNNSQVSPVGSDQLVDVNVRVVAATNRDLQKEMQSGRFRTDLLQFHLSYRLTRAKKLK